MPNTLHRLTLAKRRTHNLSYHLAPSPHAAELVLEICGSGHELRGLFVNRGRDIWGRAAEFRSAWALLDCAYALVAFEPLDLIARYALHWAVTVPDRNGVEGRGIDVRVVKRPEVQRQPGRGSKVMLEPEFRLNSKRAHQHHGRKRHSRFKRE